MNESQQYAYFAWLADAHAMELGLIAALEKQAKDTIEYPDISHKLEEHLAQTREHATKVETCLARLGGDPSAGKDFLSKVSAAAQGAAASVPDDALVKNLHSCYAAEHFEIATYTLLAEAAEELGDPETATVCREILADEEDMAAWLIETLPACGREYISELT